MSREKYEPVHGRVSRQLDIPSRPFFINDPSDVSIEDVLNVDCLAHIFSYVGLPQLVRIERVCKRWQEVSQRTLSTSLDFGEFSKFFKRKTGGDLELRYTIQILSKYGHRLTSLNIPGKPPYLGDYCANLKHLGMNLYHFPLSYEVTDSILGALPKLRSLTLDGRGVPEYRCVSRQVSALIEEAKNLKKFVLRIIFYDPNNQKRFFLMELADNYCRHLELHKFTDKRQAHAELFFGLKKLEHLQGLEINEDTLAYLTNACKVLDLKGSTHMGRQNENENLRHLSNLEVLKLSETPFKLKPSALQASSNTLRELHLPGKLTDERDWPLFPKLKILNGTGYGEMHWEQCRWKRCRKKLLSMDGTLPGLLPQCPNLEELDMSYSSCSYIGVTALIHCQKLRRLLVNRCFLLDDACLRFISDNVNTELTAFECREVPFGDGELLRLLSRCQNLTELRVSLHDRRAFIHEALDIVRSRENGKILRLYVFPNNKNKRPIMNQEHRFEFMEYRTESGRLIIDVIVIHRLSHNVPNAASSE